MLILLSPSKTQDFTPPPTLPHSLPEHLTEAEELVSTLRTLSVQDIRQLMGVSEKIATLNHMRYTLWQQPFTPENSKQALLAFKGDVYSSIDTDHYTTEDFAFAQSQLRIISGLYGLLRPLDLIQPYRLEMGIKLANTKGRDLYVFWKQTLTNKLKTEAGNAPIINLASIEYHSAIDSKKLNNRFITPAFKDYKNNRYQVMGLFAKRARGAMADFAVKNRINTPEGLLSFEGMGYKFDPTLSSESEWVFARGK